MALLKITIPEKLSALSSQDRVHTNSAGWLGLPCGSPRSYKASVLKYLVIFLSLSPLMQSQALEVVDGSDLVVQEISLPEAAELGFVPRSVRKTDSLGDQGIVMTRPDMLNGSQFHHASIEIFSFGQSIAKFLMVDHVDSGFLTADVSPDMIDFVEFLVFFEGGYVFQFGAEVSAL